MVLKWYLKRHQKRFYKENPHFRQDQQQSKKGDVHISYSKGENQPDTNKIGEYVDYEEVKDNNKKEK